MEFTHVFDHVLGVKKKTKRKTGKKPSRNAGPLTAGRSKGK